MGGGFRGEGTSPILRGSTPGRPKGSPLCNILRYPYLATNTKNFLKAPLAPIYTNFEGRVRAKKRNFLVNSFQKPMPRNAFFGLFFKKFSAAQKI